MKRKEQRKEHGECLNDDEEQRTTRKNKRNKKEKKEKREDKKG